MQWIYIALGGALGAMGRHLVAGLMMRWFGLGFPYGTLSVNILGSFAMGILIGALARAAMGDESLRLFLAVGFLGGFTTFSAFSLDVVTLFQRGEQGSALIYITASVVCSVLALVLGLLSLRLLPS